MEFTMKLRKQNRSKKTVPVKTREANKKLKKCNCAASNCMPEDFSVALSELRFNRQLCDGVVQCEDQQEFKVHRAILSAVSPFFKALFLNTLNQGHPEKTDVFVKVPGRIFSLILDFAYSGQCAISSENVQTLLAYADQLEVLGVVQLCCQHIMSHLDSHNCLNVVSFARQYFCRELETHGRIYVRHHFKEIVDSNPDYYNLTADELIDILSDDELNASSEEMVFEAIQAWVEHNADQRNKYVPKLLTCVRLGLIACCYYSEILLKWKYIQSEECQKVIRRSTLYLSSLSYERAITNYMVETIRRPRIPYEVLFAIGGWSAGSPTNFIETYDCRAKRWLLCVNTDATPRAYHGLCTLDGLIYMIGGFNGNEHFNTVRSFDPATRIWREHACMYYPRCYVSVTEHDGRIYAIGGYNGRNRMNSAERYSPEANQWELIAPMQRQRSDAGAAVLNNKIYVVGGFNGIEVLRSAEIYDPDQNQWTFIPMMRDARSGVSLLSFNNTLYAIGGFNGYTRLTTCEKYTGGTEWTEVAEMLSPRSNFAAVILDDMIYVIGGFNGSTTIAAVEYFDTNREEWVDTTPMNLNRSALSACVLPGLANARDYAYMYKRGQRSGLPDAN